MIYLLCTYKSALGLVKGLSEVKPVCAFGHDPVIMIMIVQAPPPPPPPPPPTKRDSTILSCGVCRPIVYPSATSILKQYNLQWESLYYTAVGVHGRRIHKPSQ